MTDLRLPRANQGLINLKDGPQGNAGTATRPFYDWMRKVSTETDVAELQAQIDAILLLVEQIGSGFQILGPNSVRVNGTPQSGTVILSLIGDSSAPEPSNYYGTDESGTRGYWPIPDGTVPYFIPDGETYTVNLYKQALFNMIIDVEGTLEVNGFLIEVP
jgi:hypothetical protein